MHVQLAHDQHACLPKLAHHKRVTGGHACAPRCHARSGGHAHHIDVVFDGQAQSIQGPKQLAMFAPRIALCRITQGTFIIDVQVSI